MRMALGSFRFVVSAFSVDKLNDKVSSRVSDQEIIGAAPISHLLGPGSDELDLESTFFPLHLNPRGPALLAGLQEACRAQTPLPMMQVEGLTGYPKGSWIITEVGAGRERFAAIAGVAQIVQVSLSLKRYNRQTNAGGFLGVFS